MPEEMTHAQIVKAMRARIAAIDDEIAEHNKALLKEKSDLLKLIGENVAPESPRKPRSDKGTKRGEPSQAEETALKKSGLESVKV